jgi:hypothetical protein
MSSEVVKPLIPPLTPNQEMPGGMQTSAYRGFSDQFIPALSGTVGVTVSGNAGADWAPINCSSGITVFGNAGSVWPAGTAGVVLVNNAAGTAGLYGTTAAAAWVTTPAQMDHVLNCTTAFVKDSDQSALEKCAELVHSRRGLLRPHETAALERQLASLLAHEDELAESGITISLASLDALIVFLHVHKPGTHPRLSLTRSGAFAASWSPHNRAKLTLTFANDTADWVGVDLGVIPPIRGSGAVVIGSLAGMRQPFRGWIVA